MKTSLLTVLLLATVGAAAQPFTWRFESDTCGWQARSKTVVLTQVAGEGEGSQGSLHVQGRIDEVKKYRLSPLPPSLEKARGIHPRLYLDSARITELRQALQTTHAPMWKELRE
jgi:hypothetical protein